MLTRSSCRWGVPFAIGAVAVAVFADNSGSAFAADSVIATAPATAIADTAVDAYLKAFVRQDGETAFIKGDQNGGDPGFWQEIEEIEGIEDANDRSGGVYKNQVAALLNGFIVAHGNRWSKNIYNDDIAWAVIAYTRGYQATGNAAFLSIAQSNYDLMFARGWDRAKATLFWRTDNKSYNSCIECPAGIAAVLLSRSLNDSSYLTRAQNLFAWEKANLFDATTGAVRDAVSTTGKLGTWSSTYNQGTFVGLANFLGDTASAKLAADYTMNHLGKQSATGNYRIMPEYGAGGGNNAGLNSIGLRWIGRFMRDHSLQSTYLGWLQENADTAWAVRRTSDDLSWCQWLRPTPDGILHSWDCIDSVVALQVTLPITDASAGTQHESPAR